MVPSFLIVEDDPVVARALSRLIRSVSDTKIAYSVAEARPLIRQRWLGLVIDVKLRDGSGFDVLEEARAIHPTVPAVIITGYRSRDHINHAARLQATYICKPCTKQELLPFFHQAYLRQSDAEKLEQICDRASLLWDLTWREREILQHFLYGRSRQTYLETSGISENTYKSHVRSLLKKTSHTSLSSLAIRVLRDAIGE